MTIVALQEELFVIKTDTNGHGSKQHLGDFPHLPIELGGNGSKARKNIIRKPDVGLVMIILAADLVALLLHVRSDDDEALV